MKGGARIYTSLYYARVYVYTLPRRFLINSYYFGVTRREGERGSSQLWQSITNAREEVVVAAAAVATAHLGNLGHWHAFACDRTDATLVAPPSPQHMPFSCNLFRPRKLHPSYLIRTFFFDIILKLERFNFLTLWLAWHFITLYVCEAKSETCLSVC